MPFQGCDPSSAYQINPTWVEKTYFPYFQPIIGLTSGRIEGYEALARKVNDQGLITSAGDLFSTSSRSREIALNIDRAVRYQSLKMLAAGPDAGYLTINISPNWVDHLGPNSPIPTLSMIEELEIDPAKIIVEITETEGDLEQLKKIVQRYHAFGLRVAIDDFGTGASQLDRIEALEPDIVKLDMRLFKQAARGGISADVALAITSIANRVGCQIVCEGVETEEEFHFGIECGCNYVQGFIFHPALPHFLQAESTLEQVRRLQMSYLEKKSAMITRSSRQKEHLKGVIHALKEQQLDGKPGISPGKLFDAGIYRYFVCDRFGNQITPNYEISAAGIYEDQTSRGLNWSHRPYFPLFIALKNSVPHNFYSSGIYRDEKTHSLCKTYGIFLDENRLLLVDAHEEDDVIYATYPLQ